MSNEIEITECPRDAMQGLVEFVPTNTKVKYINSLLKCGFQTIDFGSFVSPKAIPQMKDTADVLNALELNQKTKLLSIIANERGAQDALSFSEISFLGYPFSISEEFQRRNTKTDIEGSLSRLEKIQNIVLKSNRKLVVYLSMAFGNPYGEKWSEELVEYWTEILINKFGIEYIAISDTIGCATTEKVKKVFSIICRKFEKQEIGAHMHVNNLNAKEIIHAAVESGCRRFDTAVKGYGGCPMAKDDLTGNLPTEILLDYCKENNIVTSISDVLFDRALLESKKVFE